MQNKEKLVSIVLPVYNGEKYLKLSIESILEQTYKNWELIIIDDCSSDNSANIAKEFAMIDDRISYYLNESNLKLPRALNKGFSLSKGEYLSWTSDDNIYFPNAIERMVKTLENEHTEFVFATCDIIDSEGNVIEILKAPMDYKKSIIGGNCVGACFLYTRNVYITVGDYNPEMLLVEDYDYWLRIFAKFEVSNIQDILYKYRWHDGALTSTEKKDKINAMCEKVILDNYKNFGKLDWLQKYYLYDGLNELRKERVSKNERCYYLKYRRRYGLFYLFLRKIPNKIKRIVLRLNKDENNR